MFIKSRKSFSLKISISFSLKFIYFFAVAICLLKVNNKDSRARQAMHLKTTNVVLCCGGYHYFTTSFN